MADITERWAGAADAGSGSTYKVEYTLDNVNWIVADAAQAATSPYIPVTSTLSSNHAYGATSVVLDSATSFGTSGYAYLDDALLQWTGKSSNTLTGVTWHSGTGTYAAGSSVIVAHESITVTSLTISLGIVLWRITHTNPDGLVSAPAYLYYFSPPTPSSSKHCVVITLIGTDLGIEARSGLGVTANLAADTEFTDIAGIHLDKSQSAAKTQTSSAFGATFHQCWRSSARGPISGQDAAYTFVLDSASATDKLSVAVAVIPDQDWVLLGQIATG